MAWITIGTSNFGSLAGAYVTGVAPIHLRYTIDALNYLEFELTNDRSNPYPYPPPVDRIRVVIGGTIAFRGYFAYGIEAPSDAPRLVMTPTEAGDMYWRIDIIDSGYTKTVTLYSGPTALTVYPITAVALFGLAGVGTWSYDNEYPTPITTLTQLSARVVAVVAPPKAAWSAFGNETILDGAYARVTMFNAAGAVRDIYSSGYDGADALVSLEMQEYFDPTTTMPQINSGICVVKTEFTPISTEASIAVFMVGFARNAPLKVERGWMTGTGAESLYDTVTMGYFYVSEAKLDRQSGLLTIEFYDIFGVMSTLTYPESKAIGRFEIDGVPAPFAVQSSVATHISALITKTMFNIPLSDGTSHIVLDSTGVASTLVMGALPEDLSVNQLMQLLVNMCGGKWYLDCTGQHVLSCNPTMIKLNYPINQLHVFGPPAQETAEATSDSNLVEITRYTTDAGLAEIVLPVEFSTNYITVRRPLAGVYSDRLYSRDGATDTLLDSMWYTGENYYVYASLMDIGPYVRLVLKYLPVTLSVGGSIGLSGENPAVLKNPLVTQTHQAMGLASWSFPDFQERAYVFSMRDDPSLRCGNVIQLEVNNEYLDVLLVEAKRTFNGAGNVEFKAVYLNNTGIVPFKTQVTNAEATLLEGDSPTVRFDWVGVTGYDDWDNVDIDYVIYDVSPEHNPAYLVFAATHDVNTVTIDHANLDGKEVFAIATRINGVEYPWVECVLHVFDHTQADFRRAGEWLFYSGQASIY